VLDDDQPLRNQPAGPVVDALGVTLDIDDDQQVTEVLVLAKVATFSDGGGTGLVLGSSAGLDWVAQRGLVSAAQYVLDRYAD
jgi:hypothetical protein